MVNVFISYSRKDIDFAKRLTGELQKSNLDYWIDWEGIPPTVDWQKEIEKGIEEADAFVFLISPDSVNADACRQEIEHAVKNGKRLIPLIIREAKGDDIPTQLLGQSQNRLLQKELRVFENSEFSFLNIYLAPKSHLDSAILHPVPGRLAPRRL